MKYEVMHLKDYFPTLPREYQFDATLTAYCADHSSQIDAARKRSSILICPGGEYRFTSDREAEPVALRFLPLGYNAFVLRYSVAPARYPTALAEVSAALSLIRSKSDEFNVASDKVAVCGFSAGAHLACSLGVFWNEPFLTGALHNEKASNRPDALILSYPVITSGEFANEGSFNNLLGEDAPIETKEKLSLEKQVNRDMPPVFMWQTFDDELVPVENSLLLARALKKNNVPFELHIFPYGGHGLSLCDEETANSSHPVNPHCKNWFALCDEWLKQVFE